MYSFSDQPLRRILVRKMRLSAFFMIAILFFSCSEKENSGVLAEVDGKAITVEEFLNRAELTPRPHYCRKGSEKDKNIVLNTLIVEKLLALDGREESVLAGQKLFRAFIKGRKEQYMREELFNRLAARETDIDSLELKEAFHRAGYIYEVKFIIQNSAQAGALLEKLQKNPLQKRRILAETYHDFKPANHTVYFEDPEYPALHHAIFDSVWQKGDIIGPVRMRETKYMTLEITRVLYEPAMSQNEKVIRKKRVRERILERKTNQRWNAYTAKLMKGVSVSFNPKITMEVAALWSKNFKTSTLEKENDQKERNYGRFVREIEKIKDQPMFTVSGKVWHVGDFTEALSSHPLVFRKADMAPSEFIGQFKLAVIDLIQDSYITRDAYARGIDRLSSVQRNTAMWEDAYLALENRSRVLSMLSPGSGNADFHKTMDVYIERLIDKYKDRIKINRELLAGIKLTGTDFISSQQFVPYSQIVPHFPVLTKEEKLLYGRKM